MPRGHLSGSLKEACNHAFEEARTHDPLRVTNLIRNVVFRIQTRHSIGLPTLKNSVLGQSSPRVLEKWPKKKSQNSITVSLVFLVFSAVFPKIRKRNSNGVIECSRWCSQKYAKGIAIPIIQGDTHRFVKNVPLDINCNETPLRTSCS